MGLRDSQELPPGEEPELGVRGQGVSDLWLDVYRFDGPAHFKTATGALSGM